VIKSPTDGTWRRVTDSLIQYKAPQVLRGLTQQILDYKVCMNGCLNNCDTATLRITLKDLDTALGRIKNGVAPEVLGEGFFEIDSLVAYPQAQLFVYNNWNELVFKSTIPYDNRWSGTDQRESPLPSGVYYYVLRHAAPNRKLLDGKILLLR
jgi:CHU_C Type IX secretion signal domain